MTKEIIYWLSTLSAALVALNSFLLAYPGNLVPQAVLLCVGAASIFISALVAFANRDRPQ